MSFNSEERVAAIKLCLQLVDESNSLLLNVDALDMITDLMRGFKVWKKDEMFPNLVIDWEPFFNLFMAYHFRGKRCAIVSTNGEILSSISSAIIYCRYFFPKGSTAKILERIKSIYSFASSSAFKYYTKQYSCLYDIIYFILEHKV